MSYSKRYLAELAAQTHRPIDFVKWTLPLHFGGAYAYLSDSLVIGAAITIAFALAYIIQE